MPFDLVSSVIFFSRVVSPCRFSEYRVGMSCQFDVKSVTSNRMTSVISRNCVWKRLRKELYVGAQFTWFRRIFFVLPSHLSADFGQGSLFSVGIRFRWFMLVTVVVFRSAWRRFYDVVFGVLLLGCHSRQRIVSSFTLIHEVGLRRHHSGLLAGVRATVSFFRMASLYFPFRGKVAVDGRN